MWTRSPRWFKLSGVTITVKNPLNICKPVEILIASSHPTSQIGCLLLQRKGVLLGQYEQVLYLLVEQQQFTHQYLDQISSIIQTIFSKLPQSCSTRASALVPASQGRTPGCTFSNLPQHNLGPFIAIWTWFKVFCCNALVCLVAHLIPFHMTSKISYLLVIIEGCS